MDLHPTLVAVLLGLVEGITEFIPVSSTGHMVLVQNVLGFESGEGKLFEVIIQFAAIIALILLYRQKLWHLTTHLHNEPSSRRYVRNILLAFLPAAIIGFLGHNIITAALFDPRIISCNLIFGGVFIILTERRKLVPNYKSLEKLPTRTAFFIGLCQVFALFPGVSRSGATIVGALWLGADRKVAVEFSFMLAIPTILGATAHGLLKNYETITSQNLSLILIGSVTAFIAALLVVKPALSFITHRGLEPFGWYRIGIGILMLSLLAAQ